MWITQKGQTVYKEKNDLIAAIATPYGKGAISCIRISGEGSADFVRKITDYPFSDETKHAVMVPCRFHAGVKDKIMAVIYYNAKSYTGEESAELYFHGGKVLTERALMGILEAGVRLAEAGEFTRRAFLNGKIDLTQAEGIGDLIDGENLSALETAYEQSEGKTKHITESFYNELTTIAAKAEVCIDYPEEDIEEQTKPELEKSIEKLLEKIRKETEGYNGGRILREGARVVLTGKTNAGKSTLFNTLLKEERAIVSDEEGTTRDTIEEKIVYKGTAFVLIDTAGLRETESRVEKMGIERSKTAIGSADVIVHVARENNDNSERENAKNEESVDKKTVFVVNSAKSPLSANVEKSLSDSALLLNAKTGEGTNFLLEKIYGIAKEQTDKSGSFTTARQFAALKEAEESLLRAKKAVNELTLDCVCADLRSALEALGKVTGKDVSESVVDEIFSKFCVGK